MSVDESRHIFYARSEKGTIHVYDLGTDGSSMTRVAAMNISAIVQSAANIARYPELSFNCNAKIPRKLRLSVPEPVL